MPRLDEMRSVTRGRPDIILQGSDLPDVIGRCIFDKLFRDELVLNAEKTLKIAGFKLDTKEVQAIKKLKLEDWAELTLSDLQAKINSVMKQKLTRVVVDN